MAGVRGLCSRGGANYTTRWFPAVRMGLIEVALAIQGAKQNLYLFNNTTVAYASMLLSSALMGLSKPAPFCFCSFLPCIPLI
jgi:hypothetical protein